MYQKFFLPCVQSFPFPVTKLVAPRRIRKVSKKSLGSGGEVVTSPLLNRNPIHDPYSSHEGEAILPSLEKKTKEMHVVLKQGHNSGS